jgi:ectoine hydroxylase-related dioxygenase (phytanoyl-CoA dioxygenase family)
MLDIGKFIRDGWVIVDVNIPIFPFGKIAPDTDDETAKKLHIDISEVLWREEYSLFITPHLLPIVQQLIGLDVMVQYYPYFRLARPNKPQDNIGYHKDTQYGQTPYELAVHIPFVDLDEKTAIRVISGSHVMPESYFERVTADGKPIEKGSIENRAGRPYLPKCLRVPDGMHTTPLTMKVGQCAIFSPAIFHGQEVNEGDVTRVSCDLRFVSSHHAYKVRVGKIHAGYVPVSQSPVEMLSKKYYEAQNAH